MDAIILAGGKGSRMEGDTPKPLVVARGKTLIEHQLDYLLGSGVISRVVVSVGHRAQEVIEHIKARYGDSDIVFAVEEQPLGTAGGLKLAMKECTAPRVVALNGDDILDIDIVEFISGTDHKICVAHPLSPFGRVTEVDGHAVFEEKPLLKDWTSCGWYCFNREDVFPLLPDEGSLEYDVFPKIRMRLHRHEGFWQTLNTKKDIAAFDAGVDSSK